MTDGEYVGYLCLRYESASMMEKQEIEDIIAEIAARSECLEEVMN